MHSFHLILASFFLTGLLTAQAGTTPSPEMVSALVKAEQVYRKEGAAEALPVFEQLLTQFTSSGDTRSVAIAQGMIGECHWRLGNFAQSRENLDSALILKRELGDRLQEGKTLNVLGLLEWDLGNFEEAIARFGQASAIGAELGDKKLQGATLNNLSLVYDELGDYDTSLKQYQQVLEIFEQADFQRGMGATLGNIGGVHLLLGHYSEAVHYYQRALAISEQLGSVAAMSQDHGNLGFSYTGLGRINLALEHFETALELAKKAGMRQEQGFWLRGMANAQIKTGHYDLGLQNHRKALEIYTEDGSEALLLEALHDMGQLLLKLGDPTSAEQHFQHALTLAVSMGMSRGVTINQLALGDLQYRHERPEEAASLYVQALQKSLETGEKNLQTQAYLSLARVHRYLQDSTRARQECEKALQIAHNMGARASEAEATYLLAELDRDNAENIKALKRFDVAGTLATAVGDPDLQWQVEYGRALALIQEGQKQVAVEALIRSVGHIESVRSRLREKRFRAGYLQDKHQVYIELVRLQLELGKDSDAFSTAERLRAWSFNEYSGEALTRPWSAEQRQAETEMRERIRQLQSVLEEESLRTASDQRQIAINTFSRELLLAEQQYQAFLDDEGNPGTAGPLPGYRVQEAETRHQLKPGEALIEYVVGKDDVMIFVLTKDRLYTATEMLDRTSLRSKLELLRDLLHQHHNDRWTGPAKSLARNLLEPVIKAGWLDGVKHLYLVPHDMLNYLPFAVLPLTSDSDSEPIINSYTLAYLPTAFALLNGHRDTGSTASILAVAPARSKLQYAPEEAASIVELFQPNSKLLAGDAATESAFRQIAGEYRVLHLATHGYFNKLNPLLSGLELESDKANDGLLEVHEILELNLNSDLVTLSACETGMGSGFFAEIPAGDDFVGMTRAFLQAGSASVLATLWEVDDHSTVDLMKRFYTHLQEAGANGDKAVALADAQRSLRSSQKYQHPYYWAPFVLVGATNQQNHEVLNSKGETI